MCIYLSLVLLAQLCTVAEGVSLQPINFDKAPRKIVYKIYPFTPDCHVKEYHIVKALKWYSEDTCIDFVDYREASGAPITLNFTQAAANESNRFYEGAVRLNNGIGSSVIITHEVMHSLGFYHTQNRPDWKEYLRVVELADPNVPANLAIKGITAVPGIPWEYGSIMHNSPMDANHDAVLVPIDGEYNRTVGQRSRATFYDAKAINTMYKCSANCSKPIDCKNGGYVHPRDCTKCMCNPYYNGQFCEEAKSLVELDCQDNRSILKSFQLPRPTRDRSDALLSDDLPDPRVVYDLIKAPDGKRMRVDLTMDSGYYTVGDERTVKYFYCNRHGIEISDGDLNAVGKMYCENSYNGHSFTTKSNLAGFHGWIQSYMWADYNAKFTVLGCDEPTAPMTTTVTPSVTTTTITSPPSTVTTTATPTTTTSATAATTTTDSELDWCEE